MNLERLNNFLNVAELYTNLSEGKDHVLFVYEESWVDVWYTNTIGVYGLSK